MGISHLPTGKPSAQGEYLWQLSYGLVVGKFSHALAAVARPRQEPKDNASLISGGIQVAFNDVARSINGARRRDHVRIEDLLAQAGLESTNRMVGGQGSRGRHVELLSQQRRGKWCQKPRWQTPLLGQEDGLGKDYAVGEDGAGQIPSEGGRHLCHPRGPRVERVGSVTPGDHKGGGKKGGLRFCKPSTTLVLRDVTPRLRFVGCSLRVVGRILRDVGRIPGDVYRVR
jgi:hypothetical protein